MNLTCGRNPWKRACYEDSTFRAYMRDRTFLNSILPISDELNCILSRIFEPDPSQRITLPELRELILACGQLTLPSLPSSPMEYCKDVAFENTCIPEPVQPITHIPQLINTSAIHQPWTAPLSPRLSQFSASSGSSDSDSCSVFSDVSSASSASSTSSFTHINNVPKVASYSSTSQYVAPSGAWYALPSHIHRMAGYFQGFQHHPMAQIQVC